MVVDCGRPSEFGKEAAKFWVLFEGCESERRKKKKKKFKMGGRCYDMPFDSIKLC